MLFVSRSPSWCAATRSSGSIGSQARARKLHSREREEHFRTVPLPTTTNLSRLLVDGAFDLSMAEAVQRSPMCGEMPAPAWPSRTVLWLQGITLAWMLVECCVAIYAAKAAHSVALLAFGSDSFVELLSASLVLAQCIPSVSIAERRANRVASGLLFLLAAIVAATAIAALVLRVKPETSGIGMAITIAALV